MAASGNHAAGTASSVSNSLAQIMNESAGSARVTCGIEIENHTQWKMDDPVTTQISGKNVKLPTITEPNMKSTVVYSKARLFYGTFGAVSWNMMDIPGGDRRVAIMWSVPNSRSFYDNWLAVGITEPGKTSHDKNWTKAIYYNKSVKGLKYEQKTYWHDISYFEVSDGPIKVRAMMSDNLQATVHIIVQENPIPES